MAEFPGASLAVITENERGGRRVVAIQRDDKPIAYAEWWELPGGSLEIGESPEEAAVRECFEEVHITVSPDEIHGNDKLLIEEPVNTILVVAFVSFSKVLQMRLGDEGQACKQFRLTEFLRSPDVIPEQRMRLERYLRSMGTVALNERFRQLSITEDVRTKTLELAR